VLDVHAPHEPVNRWRNFFIHLATITIGLFIALSLEECVELRHHWRLVHEAEANMQNEIEANPGGEEAVKITDRLEMLQGQLISLESQVLGLDREYKKLLAAHPK
jgi:hypothetical protein